MSYEKILAKLKGFKVSKLNIDSAGKVKLQIALNKTEDALKQEKVIGTL